MSAPEPRVTVSLGHFKTIERKPVTVPSQEGIPCVYLDVLVGPDGRLILDAASARRVAQQLIEHADELERGGA